MKLMVLHRSTLARVLAAFTTVVSAALIAASLTACSNAPRVPKLDPARVKQFEAAAYPAKEHRDTTQTEELREVQGLPMRLVWTRPNDQARHPLVVYMPGAGQDARAFAHWRHEVAASGYAVLSWQPLPDDDLLPTAAGGPGQADVHAWARQRFAAGALQRRFELLGQLMAELARAQGAGDVRLKDIDLNHSALAGYELGAYTVMLAAGEQVAGVNRGTQAWPFKAYLAISPYASFDQGAFDTRYQAIRAPVLTVTSDADTDPFQLVSAPYLRTMPFSGMPPGDKFSAELRGARHAELGGRETAPGRGSPEGRPATNDPSDDPDGAQTPGQRGQGGPGGGGGGQRGGRGGGKGRSGGGGNVGRGEATVTPTSRAMQQSAVASVSVAFLDAYAQDDALARQWLNERAVKWLAPVGDWFRK